jgi:imidazolonepropionase-like amidohydrolase
VGAVRKAAREELRRGAHQIKIMASGGVASPSDPVWNVQYSREEMRAIVEEAESWRTYALAHAYTPEAVGRAVEAGVRTIEHGNLIDAATAERMRAAGTYLVPTLVTYFAIDELGRTLGFPAASQAKVARAAGVPMGLGTDLLGETHDQQSREFAIRAQVLSPAEILRSATVVNAEILRRSGELGVVEPGALADLLVVDGDPLENLSLLEEQGKHLPVVMKAGRLVVNRLS